MSDVRLQPGDAAPDFSLTTDKNEQLSLASLRGKRVILYAYPAAMTPGCTTQACDFRDSIASLRGHVHMLKAVWPFVDHRARRFHALGESALRFC